MADPVTEKEGRPKPLRAYSVQTDECGCVVFAKSGAEARRKGAGEIDLEWEDVICCRRAPLFDAFAPGPVPEEVLWANGWQFLCCRCDAPCQNDGIGQMKDSRAYCGDHEPEDRPKKDLPSPSETKL